MLLATDSSSPELAELLKLVCKTFWRVAGRCWALREGRGWHTGRVHRRGPLLARQIHASGLPSLALPPAPDVLSPRRSATYMSIPPPVHLPGLTTAAACA